MAWLREKISKNTFLTIIGIWNAVSVYVQTALSISPEAIVLITTVGNLVIAWLGVESGNKSEEDSEKESESGT